ncbi:MAG: hypothetical protein MSA78_07835, partial [Solobacterium sp.]|nr:hypothetical protein [Solobacterium sp.]
MIINNYISGEKLGGYCIHLCIFLCISCIVKTGGIFNMAKDKSLALKLLIDKQSNHLITYEFI